MTSGRRRTGPGEVPGGMSRPGDWSFDVSANSSTSLRTAADRWTAAPAKECEQRTGDPEPHMGRCGNAPVRMRVRTCSASRGLTKPATPSAADPFEDVATLFDVFLLSAPLIPLLRVGLGGDCRLASLPLTPESGVHRPVCGPGRASRYPSEGTTSMQMVCQPVDASAHEREIGRGDVRGQYSETNPCTCCTSGAFSKLNQVYNRPPMGREERTLFVRGRLRRVCTCALAEVVHVVHGKVGKPVHQRYMLR